MKRTEQESSAYVDDAARIARHAQVILMQPARVASPVYWPILYIAATPVTKANRCYQSPRTESQRLRLPVHESLAYPSHSGTSSSRLCFLPAQSRPGAGVPGTPPAPACELPLLEPDE